MTEGSFEVKLVHRDCGGETYEDWADPFRYEMPFLDGTARVHSHPRLRCRLCNVEITGDAMLEFVGEGAEAFNEMYNNDE